MYKAQPIRMNIFHLLFYSAINMKTHEPYFTSFRWICMAIRKDVRDMIVIKSDRENILAEKDNESVQFILRIRSI